MERSGISFQRSALFNYFYTVISQEEQEAREERLHNYS